jgi:hypothetical protein
MWWPSLGVRIAMPEAAAPLAGSPGRVSLMICSSTLALEFHAPPSTQSAGFANMGIVPRNTSTSHIPALQRWATSSRKAGREQSCIYIGCMTGATLLKCL